MDGRGSLNVPGDGYVNRRKSVARTFIQRALRWSSRYLCVTYDVYPISERLASVLHIIEAKVASDNCKLPHRKSGDSLME